MARFSALTYVKSVSDVLVCIFSTVSGRRMGELCTMFVYARDDHVAAGDVRATIGR
jgi:hypothetical protein